LIVTAKNGLQSIDSLIGLLHRRSDLRGHFLFLGREIGGGIVAPFL
jgi:hypothetical protein